MRIKIIVLILIAVIIFPGYADAARRNSSLRNKINDLDNDRVDELPVPILFGITPDNLFRNFGDPRGASGERNHEGLDIMAPHGAPIGSPTEAVVTRIGEGESAGIYVYTANPGGESMAFLHLSEVADIDEGDVLKVGQIIGYVGNTGNAAATAPHLHFELHDDDGDPIDPFPRLVRIFPLQNKIDALEEALEEVDDEEEFVNFIITRYKSDLLLARTLNIELPKEISERLGNIVIASGSTLATAPNMTVGARGTHVVALQNFLISKNFSLGGSVVADGSFGAKTQEALRQYQLANFISPAVGYFGPVTRAYMISHP